jgi:hypothetical protein
VPCERFAVGGDAIDPNRDVDSKDYLHTMEAIAIAHSVACGRPLERRVASGTSWHMNSRADDPGLAAPGIRPGTPC